MSKYEIPSPKRTERVQIGRMHRKKAVNYLLDAIEDTYENIVVKKEYEFPEIEPVDSDKLTLVITLADVHLGSIVYRTNPETLERDITNNMRIAHSKIDKIFIESYKEAQRVGLDKYDEIVVAVLGDVIEGDGSMYPGQNTHLEARYAWQITNFVNAVIRNLIFLSSAFGTHIPIRFVAAPGNHGKNKTAQWIQDPVRDNYDTGAYLQLLNTLAHHQMHGSLMNVSVDFPTDNPFMPFKIKGWTFVLIHIMEKNFLSPTSKLKIFSRGEVFGDQCVFLTAHYHELSIQKIGRHTVIRTGCVPGPNDYSDELGILSDEAEQLVFSVGKNKSLIGITPIKLGDIYGYE